MNPMEIEHVREENSIIFPRQSGWDREKHLGDPGLHMMKGQRLKNQDFRGRDSEIKHQFDSCGMD